MSFDPTKLTDALKTAIATAGIYKLAIALACAGYWVAAVRGFVPNPENWELRASAAGALLFGALWFANALHALLSFFQPRAHLAYWIANHKHISHV